MREFLLGEEAWNFLWQVPLRVLLMFAVSILALRLAGKRAVPQGIFEILIIIILGTSAGDPVMYQQTGVLPAIIVFATVVVIYRIFNRVTASSKKLEQMVEGMHECLISEGRFNVKEIEHSELEKDELFADLRLQNVSQIGQVKRAYIEASGKVSMFFYEASEVRKGLPIFPECLMDAKPGVEEAGDYACTFCANVETLQPGKKISCKCCGKQRWTAASEERRVQ